MRPVLALLLALLAPGAVAVAPPSCEPGTFDDPASAALCEAREPVELRADAVGLVVAVTPADDGASAGVDDTRGNAIPEGSAAANASRESAPGTFGSQTCAAVDGSVAWGPFTQGFGDGACVDA